ncbi:MAG: rhodanese-like domain-containing protein [Ignavibacteria bacterium]|nr:rhodanese-like domain-containing protein [Ignavibacteria bacterium]
MKIIYQKTEDGYITNIDMETFENVILKNFDRVNIIDIRTPDNFSEGHIEGSINIDMMDPSFAEKLDKLDRDKVYYIVSDNLSLCGLTKVIMDKMRFKFVHDIKGVISEYRGNLVKSI